MQRNILFLLFIFLSASIIAQQVTVSGTVKDTANAPLIGVTVVQKGTNNGKITDINGKFSLTVPDQSIISFSMIGYTTREITVNGSADINVTLSEAVNEIEQVVVIGYGTVKKKDITTSVAVVSTSDLQERPMSSAASAIQGKAAGVMVMSPSGEPGAGLVVRIRGNTSINASNDPLYVVDGIPMSEISFLSSNDIESMQILKDASSAAIYGSRAANGVVLITTKSGKRGRNSVTFNSSLGFNQVQEKIKSLNTQQYKDLMDEIGAATIPEGLTDQTDWFDETYRLGTVQNYQISFTGGNEKMNYYLSGGYLNEVGVIKVAYFSRYNFKANFENQLKSWLKVSSNIAYSDYAKNGIISGTGSNRAGVILSVINTPKYAPIWDANNPGQYYNNFYGAQVTHPVENMSRTEDDRDSNNQFVGSLSGDFRIASWLNFKSTMAIDRIYNHGSTFLDPKKTSYGRSLYGNATDNRSLNTVLTFDNILTADKAFGKHTLGLMAGTSWTSSKWSLSYMGASHFLNSAIKTLNAGNKIDPWGTGTTGSNWDIMSYLGRLTYNFDSKYLFTANFRADGSSKLAPGHKWGYFPSFSAAWRISSEPFMQQFTWLHDLKLRGGWGQTGNQSGLPDYGYLEMYSIERRAWWDTGQSNAVPNPVRSNMKNIDLTWETTSTTNLGLDISLLKGRLTMSTDAYYKYTKNLLFNIIMAAPWDPLLRNEGEMSNRGIEFSVNTKNSVNAFKWETDFNISFNRNKVEKFHLQPVYYYGNTSEATSEYVIRMTPGQSISKFWGLISDGVDPETGNLKFRDINHDGKITLSDKTYIGDPNPDFIYGMTNNFSWKGISLMILLQGSQGNDIYNASRMETEGMYDAKNQSTKVLDRWRRPGQITYMPKATSAKDNLVASTRFVEDGSYLRVKTLTISYMYTGKLLKKIGFSYVQPYFTAENLITFTNYKGFDPEVNQYADNATVQGIDWGTYPHSKSYVFGLNFEF